MTCWSVKRRRHAYVDRTLSTAERERIERHLRTCESCSSRFEQLTSLRFSLTQLPRRRPPQSLSTRLRVAASRERQIVLENHGSHWRAAWNRWKFRLDEFMRPITIPATGGLLSSLVLFGALAFTLSIKSQPVAYDIPVMAGQTDPTLVPVQLHSAVVLTMSLDSDGHIADYAVRNATSSFVGDSAHTSYNKIPVPDFPSVFRMAEPVTRDISISFTPIVFRR